MSKIAGFLNKFLNHCSTRVSKHFLFILDNLKSMNASGIGTKRNCCFSIVVDDGTKNNGTSRPIVRPNLGKCFTTSLLGLLLFLTGEDLLS